MLHDRLPVLLGREEDAALPVGQAPHQLLVDEEHLVLPGLVLEEQGARRERARDEDEPLRVGVDVLADLLDGLEHEVFPFVVVVSL